jgi:hypothetical protein
MGRRLQLLARASTFRGPQQQQQPEEDMGMGMGIGLFQQGPHTSRSSKTAPSAISGIGGMETGEDSDGVWLSIQGHWNQAAEPDAQSTIADSCRGVERSKIIPAVRFLHQLGLWRQRHDRFVGMGHAGRWDDGSAPGLDAANLALMFRSTPVIAVGLGRPRSYPLTVGIQALDELRMLYSGG